MSVRVTSNRAENVSVVSNRAGLAVRFMLDDIHRESTDRTPKRLGNLRADIVKSVQGTSGSIVWAKKYASKMEKKQFENYTTPGTGPGYAEDAVKRVVDQSGEYFRMAGLDGN